MRRRGRHADGVALVLDIHFAAHAVHVALSALHQRSMNLPRGGAVRSKGNSALVLCDLPLHSLSIAPRGPLLRHVREPSKILLSLAAWTAEGTYAAGAALSHQRPSAKEPLADTHRHAPAHVPYALSQSGTASCPSAGHYTPRVLLIRCRDHRKNALPEKSSLAKSRPPDPQA